jgi:Xaa-Pro aminopeptidase
MLLNRARLAEQLAADGLDAVVLATEPNIIYASGFASEFMLGRFEDNVAAVLVPRDPDLPPALIVPEFDLPYLAERPSSIADVCVYGSPWSSVGAFMGATLEAKLDTALRRKLVELRARVKPGQRPTLIDALAAAIRARKLDAARLGCDDLRVAAQLEAAGLGGNAGIADALWTMRRVRLVKTAEERAIMTAGARLNAEALTAVVVFGKPGVRESDMTRVYRRHLVEHDGRHLGDRGMMFGAGDASSFSLPQSAERVLAPGDAIVLDCLGTWSGYYMDLARTGVVGVPTAAQKRRYEAVLTALLAVEDTMKAGTHTQAVRELVRDTIAGFGLRRELVSVTTHALGLEVFEFPYPDSLAAGFALEAGMIVNTEVFYRDPELGSFHLEDSVAVSGTGCTLLHPVPRDLVVFA